MDDKPTQDADFFCLVPVGVLFLGLSVVASFQFCFASVSFHPVAVP